MNTTPRAEYGADDQWAATLYAWNNEPKRVASAVLGDDTAHSLATLCGCLHPRRDHGQRGTNHTGPCVHSPCGCDRFHLDASYSRTQEYAVEASQDQDREEG